MVWRRLWMMLFTVICVVGFSAAGYATEEYASCTGKECGYCHLDPAGGGDLAGPGREFRHALAHEETPATATISPGSTMPHKAIRLVAGYLHILTAIFWFGTILYVHIILKPAYASGGLPKGEVRLGLGSMLIMALTGAVLTYYRVPSLELLWTTRFGILLTVKIALFTVMVGSALFVVLAIGPRLRRQQGAPQKPAVGDMSLEELAYFDGSAGKEAFVAYNGTIYDMSASKLWKGGKHMGRHPAGRDLTVDLAQAPHDEGKVSAMPVIGRVIAAKASQRPLRERVFYFMAYMNLGMVLVITAILALWRWG